MRKIGILTVEKDALRFWSYLQEQEILSSLEEEDEDSGWSIWIADEDKLESAKKKFNDFLADSENEKFNSTSPLKKSDLKKDQSGGPKTKGYKEHNLGKQWRKAENSLGIVTLGLIVLSVAAFVITGFGKNREIISLLQISSAGLFTKPWGLITPIFIHYGVFHILFNMYWLYDLGNQIEKKKGFKFFITFVLLLALFSNLMQFIITSSTGFGGMSGVVYGLFGYIWIKSKLDPAENFHLDDSAIIMLFGCLILGYTGFFEKFFAIRIANTVHAAGLVLGLAWGYGSALRWNRGKK